ncbi:hypothetical protein BABINDRAFT_31470 [Babjeviella inositovora NRRL Y-12698]|uniref:Gfo/Idh/MocA-like oxidoreductase N-terminal domain-containing protein n=1 Tax=Babjeviella inositovora NRRL Y-12698 TaxID=984486 RepID=A0A1E3QX45_9ASCO|nr:uncharacterized protein BABINDRAFT_31470 [Babjeviella inositovora NRRL Y-12698]ODQ82269.1 hypothetical protein BABINDRAFT_31470 [Babjeviella inositovora NRRL Y-12698]
MTVNPKKINVAICGIGRIGKYHAMNIVNRINKASLVAGCTISTSDKQWAEENLVPHGVTIYDSYDEMLAHPGIDMVLIASTTSTHADQTVKAVEAGYHVLCEKPFSTSVADAQRVVEIAAKHPDQKILCGFSRRFDDSYRDAKLKIDSGEYGVPKVFRSQTCDRRDETGFFVKYAANSGGILVDCAIHDLDLCLYFMGGKASGDSIPKSMYAVGITAIHPELAEHNDSDNAMAVIKFHNGTIANIYASRMMVHGQEDATEIICTEGKLSVNNHPQTNLVTIYDKHGLRNEVPKDFYGRFEMAFVNEMNSFLGYIINDEPVPFSLEGNVKVLQWAVWLQESLETGELIQFDASGNRLA